MFQCIGPGWHSIEYHDPDYLAWMKGEPGTEHPEDGFYCGQCVYRAEQSAKKGKRPEVVLGPTLSDELEQRQGPYRRPLSSDSWRSGFD